MKNCIDISHLDGDNTREETLHINLGAGSWFSLTHDEAAKIWKDHGANDFEIEELYNSAPGSCLSVEDIDNKGGGR